VKEKIRFTIQFVQNVSQLHRCERWFSPMNDRRSSPKRLGNYEED
jgi:hypothetical protein